MLSGDSSDSIFGSYDGVPLASAATHDMLRWAVASGVTDIKYIDVESGILFSSGSMPSGFNSSSVNVETLFNQYSFETQYEPFNNWGDFC